MCGQDPRVVRATVLRQLQRLQFAATTPATAQQPETTPRGEAHLRRKDHDVSQHVRRRFDSNLICHLAEPEESVVQQSVLYAHCNQLGQHGAKIH